jgi:hypothetical protein
MFCERTYPIAKSQVKTPHISANVAKFTLKKKDKTNRISDKIRKKYIQAPLKDMRGCRQCDSDGFAIFSTD